MTNKEKRELVAATAKTREKKNRYTQGEKRTQVGSGWSDCSSFVRWCYLQVLHQDIGLNTAAQIVNKELIVVDDSGGKYPDEQKLLPGDLIYYKGTDASRPHRVGHVEMWLSPGKCIGHGSGTGPTVKNFKSYSASRYTGGKGYIRALRVIPADDGADGGETVYPADPMKDPPAHDQPEHGIQIIGGTVNLRAGPGTGYGIVRTGKQGEIYEEADTSGWRAILVNGVVCWVSEKMCEKV